MMRPRELSMLLHMQQLILEIIMSQVGCLVAQNAPV
jgi:hypothetical protein